MLFPNFFSMEKANIIIHSVWRKTDQVLLESNVCQNKTEHWTSHQIHLLESNMTIRMYSHLRWISRISESHETLSGDLHPPNLILQMLKIAYHVNQVDKLDLALGVWFEAPANFRQWLCRLQKCCSHWNSYDTKPV